MADISFIVPKGLYDRYKGLMSVLKMDITLSQDDPQMDVIVMTKAADTRQQDFLDLLEVIRLHICHCEDLMSDTGGVGKAWIFHR
ncbi:hypothetical protein MUA04_22970 [Enterobacteriaceae bacterium H11S18]|uniref:hypothetical protein n=1 Tax=Dryocola clanedunensis TaxID=2925396 RepID=UPI0022F022FA|nr:hypothetical protein [Dryocola clanedunensis]MCT4713033.1 hypothetical protein [Dryocola clanedunensis]